MWREGLRREGWRREGWRREGWRREGWRREGWRREGWRREGWRREGWRRERVGGERVGGEGPYLRGTLEHYISHGSGERTLSERMPKRASLVCTSHAILIPTTRLLTSSNTWINTLPLSNCYCSLKSSTILAHKKIISLNLAT